MSKNIGIALLRKIDHRHDGISIAIAITSVNKFDHRSRLEVDVYVVFHKFMLMLMILFTLIICLLVQEIMLLFSTKRALNIFSVRTNWKKAAQHLFQILTICLEKSGFLHLFS